MKPVHQIKRTVIKNKKIDGIFLLDKPQGKSSHSAMKNVQRLFQAEKAGHTGSLDPLATGMLPICLGEATKFSRFLLEAKKAYTVGIQWGITTTTGDSEGEVLSRCTPPVLTEQDLADLRHTFLGTQSQIPPMYSALKHQGKPLYKLARQGKHIERAPRTVTIELLHFHNTTLLDVVCSKGTYIRSLVEAMGEKVGCGAHVVSLRRTWVDPFVSQTMMKTSELEALSEEERMKHLLTIPDLLANFMQTLVLSPQQAGLLLKGQALLGEFEPAEWVCLISEEQFLGVGEAVEGQLRPKRLVAIDI
jgi:tRNA pseudouridine55 synthase